MTQRPCTVDGCGKRPRARGLCAMHYCRLWRKRKKGEVSTWGDAERRGRTQEPCAVSGCGRVVLAKKLCSMHYRRRLLTGEVGEAAPRKRERPYGNGWRDPKSGYVYITDRTRPGGYQLEHRYVMEQVLGRQLYRWENVHHRNGVRDDNRPSNLELWVKPQPAGQRHTDLVEWVVEHYREDVLSTLSLRWHQ